MEGGTINLNVSGLLKKFMLGKENPSFGDVFNSFKDAISFRLNIWGNKNVVNPSGGSVKNYKSKKAGYVAKMIADNNLHKLRRVVEPSKSLKAMTKRRNKKGGAMFLAGGGIEDIDITALNKNILSLLFKDVFIPLMQKFKIDTTSMKFKMMTPIIINVLKLTVDKASNIQDLIKLLSDDFLNIIFRFMPNANADNIRDNLKVILTKYLMDKSKSIVKDDTESGGSMYLSGGSKYCN